MERNYNKVVFFDGVCNLCNKTIQKLIKIDDKNILRFSSLQSENGKYILRKYNKRETDFESILYIKNGILLDKSDAVLEILNDIYKYGYLFKIFKLTPKFIRDKIYMFVSNNRYKWFGKKESCWIPTPQLKRKFLP